MTMYIKDTHSGEVREYGTNHHDSLRISNDGTHLTYEHLQCGDGSIAGNKKHSGYLFCDEEGHTPEEDEVLCKHGADAYFNIGGFDNTKAVLDKIRPEIEQEYIVESEHPYGHGLRRAIEIIDKYRAKYETTKKESIPYLMHKEMDVPISECQKAYKEEPKQVELEGDGYADGFLVCDYGKCPKCGWQYMECICEYGIEVDKEELIKALEYDRKQYEKGFADALNKVRAEIEEQYDLVRPYNIYCAEGLEMALGIIDKYKAESEVEE